MQILLDPGILDLRNKGNIALLQVAAGRIRAMWPNSALEVITVAPQLLRLYIPDCIPINPHAPPGPSRSRDYKDRLFHWLPAPVLQSLLEIREEIWTLRSGQQDVLEKEANELLLPLKSGKDSASEPEAEKKAFLSQSIQHANLYAATGAQYMSDACKLDALAVLDRMEQAMNSGIPTTMVGQGFGPIQDPELVQRATKVLPQVDLIFIRDTTASLPLLVSFGVDPSHVIFTGDDAIEMAYQSRASRRGTGIGVSLRVAHYTQLSGQYFASLRRVLPRSARQHKAPLVALPISQSAYETDEKFIEDVISAYKPREFYRSRFGQPSEIVQRTARCRIVVTGTYHAAIFALAQGIPAVCLAKSKMYFEKFQGLAEEFGDGCQILSLEDQQLEGKLAEAIEIAWNLPDERRSLLLKAAERQIGLGQSAYKMLEELVGQKSMSGNPRSMPDLPSPRLSRGVL